MTFFRKQSLGLLVAPGIQIIVILLVSLLLGFAVIIDIPIRYKLAFILAVGFTALLSVVKSPRRVLLFSLALFVPMGIGKDIFTNTALLLPVSTVSIQICDAIAVILLLRLLVRLTIDREFKVSLFKATTLPALFWLAAGAFSLINAQDLQASMIALISMGKAFLLYLVVANSIEISQDAAWLVGGILIALAFEALLGSYQGITGRYAGLSFLGEGADVMKYSLGESTVNRCEGTVCHPNSLAMYLNTCLPFALALLFTRVKRIYKILMFGLIAIGIVALVLTLSRGGWIGLVFASSLVFGLAVLRGRLKVGYALPLAVGLLVVVTFLLTSSPNLVINRLTVDDRGSAQSRVPMALGALAIMKVYPILGAGLNNYTLYMPEYDPVTFASEHGPYVVHSTFLLIGAETGLLGLAGFTWFLVSVILQAWRLLKIVHNDLFWIIGVGIFCGYIALSSHATVDFALIGCPRVFTQVWFLAGLVVGVAHMTGPGLTIITRSNEDPSQLL